MNPSNSEDVPLTFNGEPSEDGLQSQSRPSNTCGRRVKVVSVSTTNLLVIGALYVSTQGPNGFQLNRGLRSIIGFSTNSGKLCFSIGSAGEAVQYEGVSKNSEDPNDNFGLLGTEHDLRDFKNYVDQSQMTYWGSINMDGAAGLASTILHHLKRFCAAVKKNHQQPVIYYTGHGERNTGDWCFPEGGRITFNDVVDACPGQKPEIWSDACFSGAWALQAKWSKKAFVFAASGPKQYATDRTFANAWMTKNLSRKQHDDALKKLTSNGAVAYTYWDGYTDCPSQNSHECHPDFGTHN